MKNRIKVICLDLDGTVYIDGRLYPNVLETLSYLRSLYKVVFVTNTTSRLFSEILTELNALGIKATQEDLYTPARVARELLSEEEKKGILINTPHTDPDFKWFRRDPEGKTLLIADEGLSLTFEDLHIPFNLLMKEGSGFYTLQKNRFYRASGELRLDMGPLVSALEWASSRKATILGKPSRKLFELVARNNNVEITDLAMIGDDVEFDVLLPKQLGITGIALKTGKYLPASYDEAVKRYGFSPDNTLETFDCLDRIF